MSAIGTSLAAGVAGAPLSSRTASKARDRSAQDASEASEQLRAIFETQDASLQTKDSDQELPDNQAPGYETLYRRIREQAEQQSDAREMPEVEDNALYHHIDIEA